jgi:hypothetical protein
MFEINLLSSMKKVITILILAITGFSGAFAQDILTLRSGKELNVRIIRINPKDVTYFNENATDTIHIKREEIAKVHYKTGTIIYLADLEMPQISDEPVIDSLYRLGEMDAVKYYKGYKPAAIGTLLTSFMIPFGLIPAVACSSTPPAPASLGYRDTKLIENSSYYAGYADKSFKIKKKKVWRNFAIGSGVTLGYILVVATISSVYLW